MHWTIPIPPVTKKNSQQIFYLDNRPCPYCGRKGRPRISPSSAYRKYEKAAIPYLLPYEGPISYPVTCKYVFYMPTERLVDESNLVSAVDDLLVKARILKDDNRKIIISHDGTRVLTDRQRPRTEIYITPYTENGETK